MSLGIEANALETWQVIWFCSLILEKFWMVLILSLNIFIEHFFCFVLFCFVLFLLFKLFILFWGIHIHISILPQTHLPFRLPHNTEQSSMCYTIGPYWLSIIHFVFKHWNSHTEIMLSTYLSSHVSMIRSVALCKKMKQYQKWKPKRPKP